MRRFLNNRISNYNNVGDKVDDFCEDCENRWLPFSRVWWDSTEKNIADIKRKDNGIFVIKKILSLINSISESIKDIYDRINAIEPPILSEKLIELENDYLEVGVTADDKQEDLNIAIYENYINLKNTKVDKPLIESTSDSLKIVALDNQGESVFIKSNELGKVKSVNNKIGDVILKTSDLENDSDYTTNNKLNKEIQDRISADNLKLDKPTTSGTITTYPNIVGVDDLGNSAKLKASDFGKVKSVNGKEGDVILKTSDLENDSDYTTNSELNKEVQDRIAQINDVEQKLQTEKSERISEDGILNYKIDTTKTELNTNFDAKLSQESTLRQNQDAVLDNKITTEKTDRINADNLKLDKPTTTGSTISHPNVVGVDSQGNSAKLPAGDLGKNFANTDLTVSVNRKHTGTASVELAIPMIYSNTSQRFSGLLDKSADATFNQLLGVDSNGNAAKVGLNAVTNVMTKSTDAQKDAWRLASLKSNETYSTGKPIISLFAKTYINKTLPYKQNFSLLGSNLYVNPSLSTLKMIQTKDESGNIITPIEHVISDFSVYYNQTSVLSFFYDFSVLPKGSYAFRLTNHIGLTSDLSREFTITETSAQNPVNITWDYIGEVGKESTNYLVTAASVTITNLPIWGGGVEANKRNCAYKTDTFITEELVLSGFILEFNATATGNYFGGSLPSIVEITRLDDVVLFGLKFSKTGDTPNIVSILPANSEIYTGIPTMNISMTQKISIIYKGGVVEIIGLGDNGVYFYSRVYLIDFPISNLRLKVRLGGSEQANTQVFSKGIVFTNLSKL